MPLFINLLHFAKLVSLTPLHPAHHHDIQLEKASSERSRFDATPGHGSLPCEGATLFGRAGLAQCFARKVSARGASSDLLRRVKNVRE
jgi:hypothetical protein